MIEKNNGILNYGLREQDKKPIPVPEKPQRIRPKLTGILSIEGFLAYWKAKGVE